MNVEKTNGYNPSSPQADQTVLEEPKSESHFLMHESEVPLYSLGFSNRQTPNLTIAVGSYLSNDKNSIYILEVPPSKNQIQCTKEIQQPFPSTMIKFHPIPNVY